jgi:hypothetical protein
MKYAVEMSSGTIMCIPTFTFVGSGIKKLIGRIRRDPNSMVISSARISLFKLREASQKYIIFSI